jgi:UDP-N-acetylmuramate--alanine ligase
MLGRTRRVHFVGIGGIGMSGIAELLANLGYAVSGSDLKGSDVTDRLATLGVRVAIGHDARHVGDADVVVVSSAVAADNPEVVEAGRRKVPVIPRAEMLAELMRLRYGIAVAGAHGKTSTTSMIALALERAGLDPTAVIGGRVQALGGNARLGEGEYMVAEADESDRSFLRLTPTIAVLTNLDHEHLESYGTFERLQEAFVDFANKVPFYGAVVACADDPALAALLPRMTRRVRTYGFTVAAGDVRGSDVRLEGFGARCAVRYRTGRDPDRWEEGQIGLRVPGRHSLLNAMAAVAVGLEVGVPFARVAAALAEFAGVERRFELKGEVGGVMVVDDYGHHPTEIAAVIAAARAGFGRRLLVAFQPHRYTRTHALAAELGAALAGADEVVLTDVYAAGEAPIAGATVDAVAGAARAATDRPVHVVRRLDEVAVAVARLARPGDLVLTLGAGSIGTVADRILAELRAPAEGKAARGARGGDGRP